MTIISDSEFQLLNTCNDLVALYLKKYKTPLIPILIDMPRTRSRLLYHLYFLPGSFRLKSESKSWLGVFGKICSTFKAIYSCKEPHHLLSPKVRVVRNLKLNSSLSKHYFTIAFSIELMSTHSLFSPDNKIASQILAI
jgi:hypothetical protein